MFFTTPPDSPVTTSKVLLINNGVQDGRPTSTMMDHNRYILQCYYAANEAALQRMEFEQQQQQQSLVYYQYLQQQQQQMMAAASRCWENGAPRNNPRIPTSPTFSRGSNGEMELGMTRKVIIMNVTQYCIINETYNIII